MALSDAELLEALRGLGDKWRRQLAAAGAQLRTRPAPDTWSAIEYAAHSRDVSALHVYGVERALTGDEPAFPQIGDDALEAAANSYGDADAGEVGAALAAAADRLAQLVADAGLDAWTRGLTVGGTRSDVRLLLEHARHRFTSSSERRRARPRPDHPVTARSTTRRVRTRDVPGGE